MAVREGPGERLALEQSSNTPMFNTKAVVQQTGVPAATLRAWERRYNLLSPERAENAYRLYSERDIVLIRWLKEHVDSGMTISQAIALFKHQNEAQESISSVTTTQNEEEHASQTDIEAAFQVAIPQDESAEPEKSAESANEQERSLFFNDWPLIDEHGVPHRSTYPMIHNMRVVRERLVEAFNALDEPVANMMMGSMLAIYPVEQVCTELIAPTMWRVGQLWTEGKLTVSAEHFASNFFRALLTNLFHIAPSPTQGPMAIVCCAPGEPHELAPLMLALLLRRKGVRVVYLGQSIEIAGLMQTIKKLSPGLICVSLTMPAYLSSVIDLGRHVEALPPPRPIFAFGGQVFAQYGSIIPQIPGLYLSGDLQDIVHQLSGLLKEQTDNRN